MINSISTYITVALLFVSFAAIAQTPSTITKDGNYTVTGSETLTATQRIILKPNTWIKPGSTFYARVAADAYIPVTLSDNENYVFSRVFQAPITEEALLNPAIGIKSNKDVIESITYFDGLGRPKQQIGIKASPLKKDIVTHIKYDDYGRQDKQYLPFERENDSNHPIGSYTTVSINTDINAYYQVKYQTDFEGMAQADVNAYSQSIFEPSPLNRVLEQGAPGKDWKANKDVDTDHTIKFDWGTNAADEVIYFKVDFPLVNNKPDIEAPILVKDDFYDPNQLYVTITKDENWQSTDGNNHTIKEYKDKLGRVVLKRTYADVDTNNDGTIETQLPHDTYYVYDDYGNLTYVIPPKVTLSATDGVSPEELAELCYQYKYDERNRLVEKKIPGKGDANTFESIVYNTLDQPILTQDPLLKTQGVWLFTKYDAFGRVTYTGKITITDKTRTQIQEEVNNFAGDLWVNRGAAVLVGGTTMYYNNGGYPDVQNAEVLTINYYDDYEFQGANPIPQLANPGAVYSKQVSDQTKSLATGSKVKVLGTSYWINTVSYYDKKARPIYIATQNEYLNTTDVVETKLDFVGKVEETKTTHTKDSNTAIVTIDTFTYDHMGRLKDQKQTINNQTPEIIVANTYDTLGQLETKEVGGGLQEVDYTYNVRGWLKNINNDNKDDHDLFNFNIKYNDITDVTKKLYNGNISQTQWSTENDNQTTNPVSTAYTYSYDALNRITSAIDNTGHYNLSNVTYDKNGNIFSLKRKGQINVAATNFGEMDNLSYVYESGGNKLLRVTDTGNDLQGFKDSFTDENDYIYDDNGNMIRDNNKNITGITYNYLNLPIRVTFKSFGTEPEKYINYIYDATGVKIEKKIQEAIILNNSGVVPTYGTNTIITEYAGNHIYEGSQTSGGSSAFRTSSTVGATTLKFFNHTEGYIEPVDENDLSKGFDYIYQYKDHLGNIRLSYADKDNDGKIDIVRNDADVDGDGDLAHEILEENNYYPFGLQHKGYNNTVLAEHPYGYNGKEENKELGLDWLDFGARNYDAAVGRWMSPDPVGEFYYDLSSFNYGGNNPLIYTDPNGLWIVNIVTNTDNKGNTSYALSFTAEEGDDLNSLSTQLGISEKNILSAHSELGNTEINEGDSFGLGNLEEVKAINGAINEVAGKQDRWNCANFACGSDKTIKSQWDNPLNNNVEDLANILKNDYNSVSESSSKIGTIVHYRLKQGSESKIKRMLLSDYRKQLRSKGLSDAQIDAYLKSPQVQSHLDNTSKAVVADERHFSIVVLKNRSGTGVQNIVQKAGQNHFQFKVDNAKNVSQELPYAPEPVGGTNNPYYNKKSN